MVIPLLLVDLWTPLFDGKSLTGWIQHNGAAKYTVEDGCIVGRTSLGSPNSFLCTDKFFGDFELEFEVLVDPALNSGVQIRSMSVPGYEAGRVHGYQVEIDSSPTEWPGGIYDEARRGWLAPPETFAAGRKAFRKGQWNSYRVVARGDRLQTWINSKPVADIHDSMTRYGFIGLQVHSSDKDALPVKWRNIRIKDFGIPASVPPKGGRWLLHNKGDLSNWVSAANHSKPCPWTWEDNGLTATRGTGDIISKDAFNDCTLHLEFAVNHGEGTGQDNGNSGVYIMDSYEIQVLNSAPRGPLNNECGAIYGQKAPDFAMAFLPEVWQSYDIQFTSPKFRDGAKVQDAKITVYHNGTRIHDNFVLKGPTAAGSKETPGGGPIRLQEHGHPVRYRNIWIKTP